jgi:hypothetical protein
MIFLFSLKYFTIFVQNGKHVIKNLEIKYYLHTITITLVNIMELLKT